MALISIKNMYKVYEMGGEKVHALDGVDLTIDEKEFVAIVGPSGSGKSTLMNMIGCLDVPTSGTYLLDEEDISGFSDRRLAKVRNEKIGFIFQQFNLLGKMTAFENVERPAKYTNIKRSERQKRVKDALELVGLSDRMGHRPSELSGGQQQRVAVARALVNRPPVLLADEPTGNLDSKSGVEIMNMFRKLHKSGNTVIVITHDADVAAMADRVLQIYDGQIISDTRKGSAQ